MQKHNRKSVEPLVGEVDYHVLETAAQKEQRIEWWREARFGMFIHWGLYAIPAGEWKGGTNHAEWILTTAQIPVSEYEKFAPQFNPVKFDAAEWVRMAKDAGMKYIVITSKHHDGFCLWDSKVGDYDVIDATPFKRDILKELTDECEKQDVRMCFYHSIMDWHHPDYLPRRKWEKRSAEGAEYNRYVEYMNAQLEEIVKGYDPCVLWFDGEWEGTWRHEQGLELYNYVRSLKPDIIINNRVDVGRSGMAGTHDTKKFAGDFGTPEQEIPGTGIPGYDWESCMTMNRHWGWNMHDKNFKSTEDLIRKLIDIASKGGNFLLNIGPKADGTFPQESIDRLEAIGKWMKVNGDSIYGTQASLFSELKLGRSTTKGKAIYLHVFDWPEDGKLVLPNLITPVKKATLLADPGQKVAAELTSEGVLLTLFGQAPDDIATVIALEFGTTPEVIKLPEIISASDQFYPTAKIELRSNLEEVQLRYTLDGTEPVAGSAVYIDPIEITGTATVKCRIYRDGKALSGIVSRTFTKVSPRSAEKNLTLVDGLKYEYYHGNWDKIPDFDALTPETVGTVATFDISTRKQLEYLAFRFTGYITVPEDGLYKFSLSSDDGSRMYLDKDLIIDNDGLHGSIEKSATVILEKGSHPIKVEFLQKTGGIELEVYWAGPGIDKQIIPAGVLSRTK